MIPRISIVIALVLASGCTFVRGKGASEFQPQAGKPSNAFQTAYYDIREETRGVNTCTAKPPLKTLLDDGCGTDMTTCRSGVEAAAGRLDGSFETLFGDTLTRTGGQFDYVCKGGNPPGLHLLGLSGLGLLGSAAAFDAMAALDTGDVAARGPLAFALYQTGDRERALPKLTELAQLPGSDDAAQAQAVLYVGRFDGDGLVDTCMKALAEPAGEQVVQACSWYLGRRKVPEALPLLAGVAGVRALGLSGDPRAIELVTRAMNPSVATDQVRIAARVALLNLGKKEALRDYLAIFSGNIGGRKAANTTQKLSTEELARDAALEVLALTNRSFDKEIVKALKKMTTAIKNEQAAAAGWIALAYLGDESAFDMLTTLLAGDNTSLRTFVLDAVGGRASTPGVHAATGSGGILVDPRVRTALLTAYTGVASDAAGFSQAVTALAAMRAAR